MNHSSFAWRAETRQVLIIALPIIAAQLLQVGMGVIDTIMAGQINALALASIALGASIWHFAMLCGVGLMLALAPVISQHLGAGNMPLVREELRQGLWMSLIVGFLLILVVLGIAQAMPLFSIEAAIIPEAKHYLYWVAWSLPFTCLYLVPRSLNDSVGFTMPMLWIQLALLPINILGNYLLMFGHWGFPEMGAAGAALSTGIAQTLGCIALFAYTLTARRYAEYDLAKRMTPPNWTHIAALFRLGIPISVSLGMEVSMFTVITLLMGRFGVETVAGHQIALNVASLMFMVPLGISIATTVRVGHAIGANNHFFARQRGVLGISLCTGFMMLSAVNLWLFGVPIAALYTSDLAVITVAANFLVFAAIFQIGDGLQVGAIGALRGYKDTTLPMVINTICYWLIGLGTGVALSIHGDWGAKGLWVGLACGLFTAGILLNGRFWWLSHRCMKVHARLNMDLTNAR